MFDGSHRPDKLIMPACDECNRSTSTADLTASIISRWGYDSGSLEILDHGRLASQMRRQAPQLIAEFTRLNKEEQAAARSKLIEQGVSVPANAPIASLGDLTIRQLNLFAYKVVLALWFEHSRIPLSDKGRCCAFWRTKEDVARGGIPHMLLDILPEYDTLIQGRWNEHKTFEYRHARNQEDGIFGCFARFRRLFAIGFAVADGQALPAEESDWIKPSELLTSVDSPRFAKKL